MMNYDDFLPFNELAAAVAAIGPRRTVIIEGENGIGKTALHYHMQTLPQFKDHTFVDPIDCTQLSDGSIWMPDIDRERGVSRELPNERFGVNKNNRKGINGAKPVFITLDEFAKAPQYVKNYLAPVVYEHRIGDYHMPEGSVVLALTNLSVEGLGDSIAAHQRNRVIFMRMRKPNKDEWINSFAIPRQLHPSIIAFAHTYDTLFDSFLDYEPGGKHEKRGDMSKDNGMIFNPRITQLSYASPRSLHAASDVLHAADENGLSDKVVELALKGTIGPVAAENLSSFVRFGKEIVTFERVVADPEKAPLSDNPTAQLVQVMQFVTRADDRPKAEAATKYVARMREEMQSIFCNTVASSNRVGTFASVKPFTEMLAKHRIYFAPSK